MPRYSGYDQLTPGYNGGGGQPPAPVDDGWGDIPNVTPVATSPGWDDLPDQTGPEPYTDTLYPETKFNVPEPPTMGEQNMQLPSWSFTPGQQATPDQGYGLDLNAMKEMFTVPNAIRTIGSVGGTIGGGMIGGPVGAMAGGALLGTGADALARWYAGEEQNPYASLTEGAISGITAPIGGVIPGKGAGLRALGKYMLKEGELGSATNILASPFRKWSEEGMWNEQGNLNLPSKEQVLGQGLLGFGAGATVGGLAGGANIKYRNMRANQALNDFNAPIPPGARQAGNSSTVWDNVDFTQPPMGRQQGLLGAGPERVVTLTAPDIATIQGWRDQGYVMIPRDPVTGHFRMAHESVASQYIPEEPTDADVSLQFNAPDNVVPFTPRPTPEPPDLDTALADISGGRVSEPRGNYGNEAWEETPDDALRGGPVGIVQPELHTQTQLENVANTGNEPPPYPIDTSDPINDAIMNGSARAEENEIRRRHIRNQLEEQLGRPITNDEITVAEQYGVEATVQYILNELRKSPTDTYTQTNTDVPGKSMDTAIDEASNHVFANRKDPTTGDYEYDFYLSPEGIVLPQKKSVTGGAAQIPYINQNGETVSIPLIPRPPTIPLNNQPELQQPDLPLNKRVIERAQRALRPSVPTAPDVTPETLPPHLTPEYQQTLPMYPVNPEEGGTGSPMPNQHLLLAREAMDHEPTDDELQTLMWGPEGEEDPISVVSNRGLTDPHNYITNTGPGERMPWEQFPAADPNESLDDLFNTFRASGASARDAIPPPPDSSDIIGWHRSEIESARDAMEASRLSDMFEQLADENFDNGFQQTADVYQYLANLATDRANELATNPNSIDPDTNTEAQLRQTDREVRAEIDQAYDSGDDAELEHQRDYWANSARQLRDSGGDSESIRVYRALSAYAEQRMRDRWGQPPVGNATIPRISPYSELPYDPTGSLPGYLSEIDGINSEARALEHEHYWNTEAQVTEGDEQRIANYVADYAHDRAMELRQNPRSVRQVPDTSQPNDTIDPEVYSTMLQEGIAEIDRVTDPSEARDLRRRWRDEIDYSADRSTEGQETFRNLYEHARQRVIELEEAENRIRQYRRPVRLSAASNPNDALSTRIAHRAKVAAAREAKKVAEAEGYSPLPVYRAPSDPRQQFFEGMERPITPLGGTIKEGSKTAPSPPEIYDSSGNLLHQARLPLKKEALAKRLEIRVSQELMDEINQAISELDPSQLAASLNHQYADQVLDAEPKGDPGIQVEKNNYYATIWYRNSNGEAIAKASISMPGPNPGPNDHPEINSFVSRKAAGASFGRGVFAIAKEFLKLKAFRPGGSYSPHTRNFIKEVQRFLVVDKQLGGKSGKHYDFEGAPQEGEILPPEPGYTDIPDNPFPMPQGIPSDSDGNLDLTPLLDENGRITDDVMDNAIAAESVRREPLVAMGAEIDDIMAVMQDIQAESQLTGSTTTVGEAIDRATTEVRRRAEEAGRKARAMGIERGEILGGPPDDNGEGGTTVGSIFGGLQGAARSMGWGSGVSRANNPNPVVYTKAQEIAAVPRNAMTAGDASFVLRQGLGAITYPEFWKALAEVPKSVSQAGFDAIHARNQANPIYQRALGAPTRRHPNGQPLPSLAERMGIRLFEQASSNRPGPRAQAVASKWLEEGLGGGPASKAWKHTMGYKYRISNRMHTAFLNTLRTGLAERFANIGDAISMKAVNEMLATGNQTARVRPGLLRKTVNMQEALDLNPYVNDLRAKEIGDFVNTATGQAPLKSYFLPIRGSDLNLEKAAAVLNATMFSSGLAFSRLRMTQPANYIMASPQVRKEMMRSLLGIGAGWFLMSHALKLGAEALGELVDINYDYTSADFGKVRIGNVRMDVGGGYLQFLRNYGRIWAGGKTTAASSTSGGGIFQKFGEGYKAETQGSNQVDFLANKLEPLTKFAWDLAWADANNPFHMADRTVQMAIDLYSQDLYEIYKEDPKLLFPLAPIAFFGGGTQIYEQNESKGKIIPPDYDWLVKGGGGVRSLMPWNWDEEEGEYQGPNR